MSRLVWNTKSAWDTHAFSQYIDTSENPNYIQKLYLTDNFNNGDLSTSRWNVVTRTNVNAVETTKLDIIGTANPSTFRIRQNYALPDIYSIKFDISALDSSTTITLMLYSATYTAHIIISNLAVRFYINGTLNNTWTMTGDDATLLIDRYGETTYYVRAYKNDRSAILYYGNLSFTSDPYVDITTSSTTVGSLCSFNYLRIMGYDNDTGFMTGHAIYSFLANGTVKQLDYEGTQDIEERHLIQISPDGNLDYDDPAIRWYGEDGEDTYIEPNNSIVNVPLSVPVSATGKYYYQVYMVPKMFGSVDVRLAFSNYIALRDALKSSLVYTTYSQVGAIHANLGMAYADFMIPTYLTDIDARLAYSDYQDNIIIQTITQTDIFVTLRDLTLEVGDTQTVKIMTEASMDGLFVFGKFTGTLVVQTATGTYALASGVTTIINTTHSTYARIIAIGLSNIDYVVVGGIWL